MADRQIWVSTKGDNSNSGSASDPLKTIQAALNKATSGTDIMVKAGTYTGNLRIYDNNVSLISADGNQEATIKAASQNAPRSAASASRASPSRVSKSMARTTPTPFTSACPARASRSDPEPDDPGQQDPQFGRATASKYRRPTTSRWSITTSRIRAAKASTSSRSTIADSGNNVTGCRRHRRHRGQRRVEQRRHHQ